MPNYLPISSQYQCSPNNSLTISQHSLKSSIFCQDLPNSRSIFPTYQFSPSISMPSQYLLNYLLTLAQHHCSQQLMNNFRTKSQYQLFLNISMSWQCLLNYLSTLLNINVLPTTHEQFPDKVSRSIFSQHINVFTTLSSDKIQALHNLCPKSVRILSAAITNDDLAPAGVRQTLYAIISRLG